jgi:hypothetical protein
VEGASILDKMWWFCENAISREDGNAMKEFIAKHQEEIAGVLCGFDRLVFRGTLRSISYVQGMMNYLWAKQVRLTEFGRHVQRVSERVRQACKAKAEALGRPVKYLASAGESKEEVARGIAAREKIQEGLVCVLSCVEPCRTFEVYRNREARKLELVARTRKCLFLYHYWMHREFGFLHVRLQTWFPFSMQVCLNGREWLARQMDQAGMKYVRQDNCFPWVQDWEGAQELLRRQVRRNWPQALGRLARELNPLHARMFRNFPVSYYWTTYQSEWAIDVVFRQASVLRRLYPRLVHYAMTTLGSSDVLRYLGRPVTLQGQIPKTFRGEVTSDLQWREEGVRIKHRVNGNSVKLYDKAFTAVGSVLRAETTIQQAGEFRVFRRKEGDARGKKSWRVLRGGVADLYRRAEISERAAERYLDALAGVDEQTTLEELIQRLGQPRQWKGRRVRALRPLGDDRALLETIRRGEFTLNGFRNRDLQKFFFVAAAGDLREARRRSARVSRQLRLLRAHGLIRKVPGTYRYQLTETGQKAIAAILKALRSTIRELIPEAA